MITQRHPFPMAPHDIVSVVSVTQSHALPVQQPFTSKPTRLYQFFLYTAKLLCSIHFHCATIIDLHRYMYVCNVCMSVSCSGSCLSLISTDDNKTNITTNHYY